MSAIIQGDHCEACGSTNPENINTYNDEDLQGYSRCCNEAVVSSAYCTRTCTHEFVSHPMGEGVKW